MREKLVLVPDKNTNEILRSGAYISRRGIVAYGGWDISMLENLCWACGLTYKIQCYGDGVTEVELVDEFQSVVFVGKSTPEMICKACAYIDFRRSTELTGFNNAFDDNVNNMRDYLGIKESEIN